MKNIVTVREVKEDKRFKLGDLFIDIPSGFVYILAKTDKTTEHNLINLSTGNMCLNDGTYLEEVIRYINDCGFVKVPIDTEIKLVVQ